MAAVRTRFTELVGCRLPFQLAVLGGVGTAHLAATVIRAGGLGMVPWGIDAPEPTLGPAGVGFLMPFAPTPEVVTETVRGLRVAEFFFGEPDAELVRAGHQSGAVYLGSLPASGTFATSSPSARYRSTQRYLTRRSV